MTDSDRRDFLKRSAAAAAALGVSGADAATAKAAAGAAGEGQAAPTASPATLRALGAAVLPARELGDDGIERVVTDFEHWIGGFAPVAELPHGYLQRGLAEIRYGPPDPGPRWAAQLEALELEAERRHRSSFAELTVAARRALIEGQLERDELDRLPSPGRAHHVALGLMAFFYDSSEANDLCYRASIGQYKCRGLSTSGREPRRLNGAAGAGGATRPSAAAATRSNTPAGAGEESRGRTATEPRR